MWTGITLNKGTFYAVKFEPEPEPAVFLHLNQQKNKQGNLRIKIFDKISYNQTNINTEIFTEYFKYQNPTFLSKDLSNANKTRNKK